MLVPLADILTPNQFELGLITGRQLVSWPELQAAAEKVQQQRGARLVVTGCTLADTLPESLENIVFDGKTSTRLTSRLSPISPVGTGDLFTGLLTANLTAGRILVDAAREAATTVLQVLERTIVAGEQEMQLGRVSDILFAGRS